MNRKPLVFGLALACLMLLAVSAPSARAQVFTVDENGTPDPFAGAGSIVTDPTLPVPSTPTVGYFLPFPSIPGDVIVFEPPTVNGPFSDLLRFVPSANGTLLLIYSDVSTSDPGNAKADVGLPPNLQTNLFRDFETGLGGLPYTEASNGLFYAPAAGGPGSPLTGLPVVYNFISDSVPEPGMLCLIPAVAALLMRNRRRTTPA